MKNLKSALLVVSIALLASCTPAQKEALARDGIAAGVRGIGDILGAAISLAQTAPSNSAQWKAWAEAQAFRFGRNVVEEAGKLLAGASPETVNSLVAGQSLPSTDAAPRAIGFVLPSDHSTGPRASSTDGALGATAGPTNASSGAAVAGSVSSSSRAVDPRVAARWLVENPSAW